MNAWSGRVRGSETVVTSLPRGVLARGPDGAACAAVLGAGAWGTAIAIALARQGRAVRLYARRAGHAAAMAAARENAERLDGCAFPAALDVAADPFRAVEDAGAVFLAATSDGVLGLAEQAAEAASPGAAFVVCAKGLTRDGGLLTTAVAKIWRDGPVLFLSGPSFARETADGRRTIVALAGPFESARRLAAAYSDDRFVLSPCADAAGVQVAGVFKNVAAILCGAADGLGAGANTRAALMSEAIREAGDLTLALGGEAATLLGPAGFGDFALTCTDPQSRNYRLGRDLALHGAGDGQTHEGAANVGALLTLAARAGVETPLVEVVDRFLCGDLDAVEAVEAAFAQRLAKARGVSQAA